MNIDKITHINGIIINRKILHVSILFNPVFFMLLTVKSFEKFPKHN